MDKQLQSSTELPQRFSTNVVAADVQVRQPQQFLSYDEGTTFVDSVSSYITSWLLIFNEFSFVKASAMTETPRKPSLLLSNSRKNYAGPDF